jgi:O-antigen/teichoic acid export membrane protein
MSTGFESKQVRKSLGWTTVAQFAGLGIRLVSTVVVARFLPPSAYGLLGAAMAAVTMLEWLTDLGIVPGLTRSPNGDRDEWLRTGWSLNFTRGMGLAAVGVAIAWPWAALMRQPDLGPILAALALRPAILALRSPGSLLYRRRMNFKAVAIEEVLQTFVGASATLATAVLTGSVWALVAGTLVGAATVVATSYVLAPGRPHFSWNAEALHELRRFGSGVMLNTIAMAMSQNLDRLAGPRVVTIEELGLYSVAANLAAVGEGLLVRMCDVHFAALSRRPIPAEQRAEHARIRRKLWAPFLFFVIAGAVAAPFVVRTLYDDRYRAAGLILSVLLVRLGIRMVTLFEFQRLLAAGILRPATLGYLAAIPIQAVGLYLVSRDASTGGEALAAVGVCVAIAHFAVQSLSAKLYDRIDIEPASRE